MYSIIQKIHPTVNIKTAEAAKVIENTQRDLNIALMNEIALICDKIDLDVIKVIEAASTKWNFNKYLPGPGVGGHCLPHDPYYLVKKAKERGYHAQVILSGRKVNDEMPLYVKELIIQGLNHQIKSLKNSRILIFGASYKKNVDDLRTSPTEILVENLLQYQSDITIIEPNINQKMIFNCKTSTNFSVEEISSYDALVFMVAHDQFKSINNDFFKQCAKKNPHQIIIDGVRMHDGPALKKLGFIYLGIGAGDINNTY